MPTTRRSTTQPPSTQPLTENPPAHQNQGLKNTGNIAGNIGDSMQSANTTMPTTPPQAVQKKRGRKAVFAASDNEGDAPNKKAKNTKAGTTNKMATLVKARKPSAPRKPTKAQIQTAAAKEAKQQAYQTKLDNAKHNLAQMQIEEDQRRALLAQESIQLLPAKGKKCSAEEIGVSVDSHLANNNEQAMLEPVAVVSICSHNKGNKLTTAS